MIGMMRKRVLLLWLDLAVGGEKSTEAVGWPSYTLNIAGVGPAKAKLHARSALPARITLLRNHELHSSLCYNNKRNFGYAACYISTWPINLTHSFLSFFGCQQPATAQEAIL